MATLTHQNNFATNLTSGTTAGDTTSPLNSIPTVAAPFYLAFDATNINSHYEVVLITSKTATNVNHAATTYSHTTAEEVRMIIPAAEMNNLATISTQVDGAWVDYVPVFTASTGTPTSVYQNKAAYTQIGKTVHGRIDCVITNKGTASAILRFTLPVTAADAGFGGCGAESAATGLALSVYGYDTTHMNVVTAAAATVWVDNYRLQISFTYQAA